MLCEVLTLLLEASTIRGKQNSCIAWSHCSTLIPVTTLVATCSTRIKWRLAPLLDHEARFQAIYCSMMKGLPRSTGSTLNLIQEVHRKELHHGQHRAPQFNQFNISPSLANEDNGFPMLCLVFQPMCTGIQSLFTTKATRSLLVNFLSIQGTELCPS